MAVSKPAPDRACVDLGHKAVASEQPQPRVRFFDLEEVDLVMHSEEHLVLEGAGSERLQVGDVLYEIPRHICPTVALHEEVVVVEGGEVVDQWTVEARRRRLTV